MSGPVDVLAVQPAPDYMTLRAGRRALPVSGVDDGFAMLTQFGLNTVGSQDRVVGSLHFRDGECCGQFLANRHGDLRWVSTSQRAALARVGGAS